MTWRDHLIGFLIAAGYLALLIGTSDLGMSRDEGMYVVASKSYAHWFEELFRDPDTALQQEVIDRYWVANHEHPALMKTLFALSYLADQKWSLFNEKASLPFRFPAMIISSLILWLTYIFGARTVGRQAGAFAAISLGTFPHFFYHSHLNCFDVPIVFFILLTTYFYWRSLRNKYWAIATAIAFGLALSTKHNSWILPGIFLIHFCFMSWTERTRRKKGSPKQLSYFPWWLVSMLIIGPVIFYASWPWIWHDTTRRLTEYALFHVNHVYYNMAYFGVNYFEPPFPISYPFVMTAYTVPLVIILLTVFTIILRVGTIIPQRWVYLLPESFQHRADLTMTDLLLVGSLLAPLVMIALPSTPIFGGTKHWLSAYPFMCLYAGYGAQRVVRLIRKSIKVKSVNKQFIIKPIVLIVLLTPGFLETIGSHPFGLAHYTYLAGGPRGAADDGMNRQFWGYMTGSLGPFFRQHLPEGGSIWICDTLPASFEMMKEDGLLPSNLRVADSLMNADYALVHYEHHFAEVEAQIWVQYEHVEPAFVLTHDGVPMVFVYENRLRRNQRRTQD